MVHEDPANPEASDSATPVSSKKRKSQIDEIEVDLALPEPPSKKAKRLLKKGKTLPTKPKSDDEAEEDDGLNLPSTKSSKDQKEKKKHTEFGVWIGNLPFALTRLELFKWLVDSSGGVITEENITRVNLPTSKVPNPRNRPQPEGQQSIKQNKGFAYVDFDSEAAHVAAMALTETELKNRHVLIKDSKSFEGRPKKESTDGVHSEANGTGANGVKPAQKEGSKKIYVGNLGFQTTEDDLRTQFEKCGEIEWIKVATFEDSGKCKGFGWVKFKEAEAADWAVKGFVKVKEEQETEDDFKETSSDDHEDAGKEKHFKTRKWWVNRLRGRDLRIELAEDDQVRYRKRFGKDAPSKRPDHRGSGRVAEKPVEKSELAKVEPTKRQAYGDADVATYLTGGIVRSQGKKVTFD